MEEEPLCWICIHCFGSESSLYFIFLIIFLNIKKVMPINFNIRIMPVIEWIKIFKIRKIRRLRKQQL